MMTAAILCDFMHMLYTCAYDDEEYAMAAELRGVPWEYASRYYSGDGIGSGYDNTILFQGKKPIGDGLSHGDKDLADEKHLIWK